MRAGIIICERDCKNGELDYPLVDGFLSNTKGPSLETPWGEGPFGPKGYTFQTGQGLSLAEGRCVKGATYTIYIKASLGVTTGWRRMIGTDSWADNGVFVNSFFQTFPVRCSSAARASCSEPLSIQPYVRGWVICMS
jgi:hypothetical protein